MADRSHRGDPAVRRAVGGPVQLRYAGRPLAVAATPGQSVAAALANAGIFSFGRDVVDERRVVCGMGVCFACRVDVDGNEVRACQARVRGPGPVEIRECAAPPVRRARVSGSVDSARSIRVDVAVVGAGPAGLAAAVHAAEARPGASVAIFDAGERIGGQIWRHGTDASAPAPARAWLERAAAAGVRLYAHAEVFDADDRRLLTRTPDGLTKIEVAGGTVLATGARERWLPFIGSTLPRVMGVGALQAMMKSGLDVRGTRIVLGGTGPLALAAAADLRDAGARVRIVEQATRKAAWSLLPALAKRPGKFGQAGRLALKLGPKATRYGSWIVSIEALGGTSGDAPLRVTLGGVANGESLAADFVGGAFGLVPEIRLGRLLGCGTVDLDEGLGLRVDERQATSVAGVYAAGEVCGIAGVDAALAEGEIAGRAAVGATLGLAAANAVRRRGDGRAFAQRLRAAFRLQPELIAAIPDEAVACRCEGVTVGALRAAGDARAARLQHRCAMGPCQGRLCEPALRLLGDAPRTNSGQPTATRPPLFPITLGELAAAWGDPP